MLKLRCIFKDENGFSSLTIVVALLVSLSLIFSTAQVYKLNSASADIQNVADSSAIASENMIGEFMILVRICDSVSLSLSLGGILLMGGGVVALCIPFTESIGTELLDMSHKMFNARDSFASKSSDGLNNMQKSLPYLCSVKAYQTAKANNGGSFHADYLALSLLMPGEGTKIYPGNIDSAKNTLQEAQNNSEDLKRAAKDAESAAKQANDSKLRAFMADCGNNPNYCMYERAFNKANMKGSTNPLYKSVDNWSFSAALKRTQYYYPSRYYSDAPENISLDAQINSVLRKKFYCYASNEVMKGYVNETQDSFSAYFPHLPKNTEEMRSTSLYDDIAYPVSNDQGQYCMHAVPDCPGCKNLCGYGSIRQMEESNFQHCDICKFSAASVGKIAAASSSIDNGYEYHYRIVEEEAKNYQSAIEKAKPANNKVKNIAGSIFDKLKDLVSDCANKRLYAKPPGSYGCITMVINKNSTPVSSGFESSFINSNYNLGIRMAVSSATLVEQSSNEGKTVLNSILSGYAQNSGGITNISNFALSCWSNVLKAYSDGQNSLICGLENLLNQIPLASASGLGTWAAKRITNVLKTVGLEAANINSLKAICVNSKYPTTAVLSERPTTGQGTISKNFAIKYLYIQDNAIKYSNATNSILTSLNDKHELAKMLNLNEDVFDNGKIEIATISPLGDWGPSIPITITLPKFATSAMSDIVNNFSSTIQSILGSLWGGKIWR